MLLHLSGLPGFYDMDIYWIFSMYKVNIYMLVYIYLSQQITEGWRKKEMHWYGELTLAETDLAELRPAFPKFISVLLLSHRPEFSPDDGSGVHIKLSDFFL